MSIRAQETRRLKLMHALAVVGGGTVAREDFHWFALTGIESQRWIRKTYTFEPIIKGRPVLYQDLDELRRRDWIEFDDSDNEGHLQTDPRKWSIGLKEEGLKAAHDFATPWYVRAYEKQPVTAWQIATTFIISVLTFLAGWWLSERLRGESQRDELRKALEPKVRQELRESLAPVVQKEMADEMLQRAGASTQLASPATTQSSQ